MSNWPILLSVVTFLPAFGALVILLIKDEGEIAKRNIRNVAFFATIATLVVSLFIWGGFDTSNPGFQFVEKRTWIGNFMSYHMGWTAFQCCSSSSRHS
ncbi:MAG: hypothetical protein R3D29_04610 [Nitratireductor sp.]